MTLRAITDQPVFRDVSGVSADRNGQMSGVLLLLLAVRVSVYLFRSMRRIVEVRKFFSHLYALCTIV